MGYLGLWVLTSQSILTQAHKSSVDQLDSGIAMGRNKGKGWQPKEGMAGKKRDAPCSTSVVKCERVCGVRNFSQIFWANFILQKAWSRKLNLFAPPLFCCVFSHLVLGIIFQKIYLHGDPCRIGENKNGHVTPAL